MVELIKDGSYSLSEVREALENDKIELDSYLSDIRSLDNAEEIFKKEETTFNKKEVYKSALKILRYADSTDKILGEGLFYPFIKYTIEQGVILNYEFSKKMHKPPLKALNQSMLERGVERFKKEKENNESIR